MPHNNPIHQHLRHLTPFLAREGVTEVCVNRPGEVWVESREGWSQHDAPALTYHELDGLARTVASHTSQRISQSSPILSATLPSGERIQIVRPPATLKDTISLTIRKPPSYRFQLDDYEKQGAFAGTTDATLELSALDRELLELRNSDPAAFLRKAVQGRKNIIVSGSTGSGKTTLMRALLDQVPISERLLSVENVDELMLYQSHPNSVSLFYSAGGQGAANVSQKELIESALRMNPSRVFVAELIRGEDAFYYLRNVNSGHPGSITSMHANNARLAIEQLVLFVKESAGASLSRTDIKALINLCVDVIVQISVINGQRKITEIYYEPENKLAAMA